MSTRAFHILIAILVLLALGCAWLIPWPAHAAANTLTLAAVSSRSDVNRGDVVIVDGYLFNDGAAPFLATLGIEAPPGLDLIRVSPILTTTPLIAPGRALHLQWAYQVRLDAPRGLQQAVVVAFDDAGLPIQATAIAIRIGPITSAAPARPRGALYLPTIRR